METKALDNLNRDQLFEELKGKCKSIVKHDLYGGIALILIMLLLFSSVQKLDEPKNIFIFISWIVIVCMGVCSILFDVQYFMKVGKQDTPDQLLYCFEKNHRYRMIFSLVTIIFIFGFFLVEFGFHSGAILGIALVLLLSVLLFYRGIEPLWYRKDKDIIEQLRELAEKK